MNEIATLIIGILLGLGLAFLYLVYKIKTVLNTLDRYIDQAIDDTLMGITVEKHDGVYRFYRANDKQFLCQTTALEEIRDLFQKQFPDKTCYIDGGDDEVVAEIKKILIKTPLK